MSLPSTSYLKTTTMLEQLLEEINFQRAKEMRQLLKDESGFVVLQGTTYWTDLFVRHFLFQEEQAIDCDDLLFFVRKRHVKGSSRYLPKYETDVEVFRKDSKKLPIGDPEVDWEETVYLNLIVHQFDYTLTLAVCTRTSPKELQVLRRRSHKVYASPSRRKMDTKGEGEEITYPHICFMVDNFDEVFSEMVVRDGEMVCVEVVAAGRGGTAQAVIFLGSIRYDALTRVYDARQTSLSTKVAQRMSFGLMGGSGAAARCEFVRMKGPGGKGHAEMAVARPHAAGVATPSSEPGAPGDWDLDWDDDPEELFLYKHQRRLSDPSGNFGRGLGGWRAKEHARSENEGLDSLVSGLPEVDAGDVRDASSGALGPAALQRPLPAARGSCELACDATDLDSQHPSLPNSTSRLDFTDRETVRGREEQPFNQITQPRLDLPVGAATQCKNEDVRAYCTLPRKTGGVAAALYRGEKAPPCKTTPDGTTIYYWCDLPKKTVAELDDGAYKPVWALRGFSQSFHLWKEGRRQQSLPLTTGLTYVALPWWSIARDILDHREEPILTF